MNIVEAVELRDRRHWEDDVDGWGYVSESNRIGWELARIVSGIYGEPQMLEDYQRKYYVGLPELVRLADMYGIDVEIGDSWIRFGPGTNWLVTTVNFTAYGDAFGWKATVEKALG